MAKAKTVETDSSYYPPRARWYSSIFNLHDAIRRRLWLDRIHLPQGMTFAGSVASFLVPGLGFYIRGPRLWGKTAMMGSALLFLFFLVGFGYPAGNFALGLLLAVHATGFMYYCSPLMQQEELRGRLGIMLVTVLAMGLLFYLPVRNFILYHWLVPLRLHGRVFVVERQFPAAAIQRGDLIAYKLGTGSSSWEAGWAHGAVYMRSGMGLGSALARAGDRVGFSTNGFTVNGILRPLLPHMPQTGEVAVPEKHWFVWPDLSINGYGNTPEANITATMLQLALVPETDFVGKPFKRWLWRRQILL